MRHRALRHLLPLSDRHPPWSVGLADLGGDRDLLRDLIANGLLVERSRVHCIDNVDVIDIGGDLYLVSADGDDEPERVHADDLRAFEIDVLGIARNIREVFGLDGPDVESVTPRLTFLGSRGQRARREAVYLSRGMSPKGALHDVALAKGHDQAPRHTILTPTGRNLPTAVLRQIEAQDARVIDLDEHLDATLAPDLPLWSTTEETARLNVDVGGMTARLDGRGLKLTRRGTAVLVELAGEAATEGGFVSLDRISDALESVTGHGDRQDEQISKVISDLRKELKPVLEIENSRGVGYRLVMEPQDVSVF